MERQMGAKAKELEQVRQAKVGRQRESGRQACGLGRIS